MKKHMIIVNGKKAGRPDFREAVMFFRENGHSIDVRVTFEYGDCLRYVKEAHANDFSSVIAAGGDGTVNEVSHSLAVLGSRDISMAVIPMGTANDFAVGCKIPLEADKALELALTGTDIPIDLIKVNDRHFINIASAGFGARVTSETPVELKDLLGGGAYILMGIIRFANFVPYKASLRSDTKSFDCDALVGAICNGRQTGNGQVLAPSAYINDGLMDVLIASPFGPENLLQVKDEVENPGPDGAFIKYFQCSWLEGNSSENIPLNLDGEPYTETPGKVEVVPSVINLILPEDCPCVRR